NVCVRINKNVEYLLGDTRYGSWRKVKEDLGEDKTTGHKLIGARSIWAHNAPPIRIDQIVEIVPGGLSDDGKRQLLDTCLVQYRIHNDDSRPNTVGLRFLLDTFIGDNDAVPFTIAGAKELCDTMQEFNKADAVPDFISALQRQDLREPGIVAHLSLKYGAGI